MVFDKRKHILFLKRKLSLPSNSGLPYSFSEMVNIYMTVLEYHNFFHVDIEIGISVLQAKSFASLIPFFLFFFFFRRKLSMHQ